MYADVVLRDDEARLVEKYMRRNLAGHSAEMVMICPGDRQDEDGNNLCPRLEVCPMVKAQRETKTNEKKIPVGARCPIEANMYSSHYQMMALYYNVDEGPAGYADQQAIAELAGIEVVLGRLIAGINASNPDHIITQVSFDEDHADPILTRKVGPLSQVIESYIKRKDKLIAMMVGSRKARQDVAMKMGEIAGKNLTDLFDRVGEFIDV